MKPTGKIALVTGGASGLGSAVARRLLKAGVTVIIADINAEAGQSLADELGAGAHFVATDITSEESVRAAIQRARDLGGLHIAVNCAGILIGEKVLGRDGPHRMDRFRKVIEVNLVGTFNVIRLAAELMRDGEPNEDGERGVIITTASVAAVEGQVGQCAYSASKAGINGLVLPAARELAAYGIRVCAISPGIFDTAMIGGLPDNVKESLGKQPPFPARLGKPIEYAELALHIIWNPMLNGTTIRLDGGLRMAGK